MLIDLLIPDKHDHKPPWHMNILRQMDNLLVVKTSQAASLLWMLIPFPANPNVERNSIGLLYTDVLIGKKYLISYQYQLFYLHTCRQFDLQCWQPPPKR